MLLGGMPRRSTYYHFTRLRNMRIGSFQSLDSHFYAYWTACFCCASMLAIVNRWIFLHPETSFCKVTLYRHWLDQLIVSIKEHIIANVATVMSVQYLLLAFHLRHNTILYISSCAASWCISLTKKKILLSVLIECVL